MNKEETEAIREKLQDLSQLAERVALKGPGDFTVSDLENALTVMMVVTHSIAWTHHTRMKLTAEQKIIVSSIYGEELLNLVTLFTGAETFLDSPEEREWPETLEVSTDEHRPGYGGSDD